MVTYCPLSPIHSLIYQITYSCVYAHPTEGHGGFVVLHTYICKAWEKQSSFSLGNTGNKEAHNISGASRGEEVGKNETVLSQRHGSKQNGNRFQKVLKTLMYDKDFFNQLKMP